MLLAGCAACPAGQQPASVTELLFGRALPGGGIVAEADWDDFLAQSVTPTFPDGLTVQDATGQWRAHDGRLLREPAKRMLLVLPGLDAGAAAARTDPVAEAYRQRFRQESVLRLQHQACVAF